MKTGSNILDKILARKREEIAQRKKNSSIADISFRAAEQPSPRGFLSSINATINSGKPAVIAEIKKASPSKGLIRENFNPQKIAESYERGGASCISVLTDKDFFQGSEQDLILARESCRLPVLRKDFIVDPWQVVESRSIGSDCILLIAAALEQVEMKELISAAEEFMMDVLIEVHDLEELERALDLNPRLLGINNRNLTNFETSLEVTLSLISRVPKETTLITESGIHTVEDVSMMRNAGVNGFLVGESLMRHEDSGLYLNYLFNLKS